MRPAGAFCHHPCRQIITQQGGMASARASGWLMRCDASPPDGTDVRRKDASPNYWVCLGHSVDNVNHDVHL